MQRVTEPELMNEESQVLAYAQADFSEPHNMFIELFRESFPADEVSGHILDLGCGAADISIRFAKAFPHAQIHGLDGAENMLKQARHAIEAQGLQETIHLYQGILPEFDLPQEKYSTIISNSLLHHLHQPEIFWQSIKRFSTTETKIFVMDLLRPDSIEIARQMVVDYANNEPQVLKDDFYHSLCAAFTEEEIRTQLEVAKLPNMNLDVVSDRHVIVYGKL